MGEKCIFLVARFDIEVDHLIIVDAPPNQKSVGVVGAII